MTVLSAHQRLIDQAKAILAQHLDVGAPANLNPAGQMVVREAVMAIVAAIAEEREACATIADKATGGDNLLHSCADNNLTEFEHGELHGKRIRYDIAAAIRARS